MSRRRWGPVRRGGLDQVWGCRRGEPVLSVRGAVRSAEPWWKGRGAVEGESGAQHARLSVVTPLGAGADPRRSGAASSPPSLVGSCPSLRVEPTAGFLQAHLFPVLIWVGSRRLETPFGH